MMLRGNLSLKNGKAQLITTLFEAVRPFGEAANAPGANGTSPPVVHGSRSACVCAWTSRSGPW